MKKIFLLFVMLIFCLSFVNVVNAGYESHYPPEQSGTYVRATTNNADTDYRAWYATDPTKSLVGSSATNEWRSLANIIINQRFHIDLGSAEIIDRIYYENSHSSGFNTNAGVKDFTFWGSNDSNSFDNLTYEADLGWIQLEVNKVAFDEHAQYSDYPDPKYVIVNSSISYRYYSFKFANNYGRTSYMSVRRIELQSYVPDFIAPKYSNNFTDSIFADSNILHSLKWEDDTWLSGYIFSFDNGSGNFVNDSWVAFDFNPDYSDVYKTINSTGGAKIRWCVYANDTSTDVIGGNWNSTSCEIPFSYITIGKDNLQDCYELNKGGIYNLSTNIINKNVSVCINISSNNVVLDCGGYVMSGINKSGIAINIDRTSYVSGNINIKNCVISDWNIGVYLKSFYNCDLDNVTFDSNNYGTYFSESDAVDFKDIYLNSNNYGIYFNNVDDNTITNVVSNLNEYSIYFAVRADNNILNNINSNYDGYGVYWDDSSNNKIINSKIANSIYYGIYLINPNLRGKNEFYNNLLNNTNNIFIDGGGLNEWNTSKQIGTRIYSSGIQIGGNYYTNSTGTGYSDTCIDADRDGFCYDSYSLTTNNIDYLPLSNLYSTTAPHAPMSPNYPVNEDTGIEINPTLNVTLTDPDGDTMNITFINASDDSVIGIDTAVANGSYATYQWSGLSYGTTYNWYVNITDGTDTTTSSTYSFTTNYLPTIQVQNTFINSSTKHSFNVTAGVSDNDNYSDIVSTNISTSSGNCDNILNSTSGNYFNSTFNCSGTALTSTNIIIGFTDTNGNYTQTTSSSNTYPNQVPTVSSVTISPSTAYTNDSLECNATITDIDADTLTAYFKWYVNNSLNETGSLSPVTNGTSTLISTLGSGNTTKGNEWICEITPYDGTENGTALNSSVKTISNYAPTFDIPLVAQSANSGVEFTYDINASDIDLDTITYSDNTTLFDINSSTGIITDTPTESETGTHTILITIGDGEANTTSTFVYTITDATNPTYSGLANNGSTAKVSMDVNWSVTLADGYQLDYFIFSYNDSDSWVNDSSVDISGTSYFSNITKTIATTQGKSVCGKFYFNDTSGNKNTTSNSCFTVVNTAPTQPSLTNPANNSHTNIALLNWTASTDADSDSINYYVLLNNSQICYTSDLNCSNVTSDGFYLWNVTAFDGTDNTTSISRQFTYDTTNPLIAFDTGTLANNSYRNQNFIYANWTFTEANLMNITARLYNSTLNNINTTTFITATYEINWTNLADLNELYYYNITIYDNATNYNETETRVITLDNTLPVISAQTHTAVSGRNILWIYEDEDVWLNATVTDLNLGTVLLSSNFNGTWVNYSTSNVSSLYYFRVGKGNLSHSQVQYKFWANDTAGNSAFGALMSFTPLEVKAEPIAQSGGQGTQGTSGTGISPQVMSYICGEIYAFSLDNLIDYKINYSGESFIELRNGIYTDTGVMIPEQQLRDYIANGEFICNYTLPKKPEIILPLAVTNLTKKFNLSKINPAKLFDYYLPFPAFSLGQVKVQEDAEKGWISALNIPFLIQFSDYYTEYPNVLVKGTRWAFIIGLFLVIVLTKSLRKRKKEKQENEKNKSKIFLELKQK